MIEWVEDAVSRLQHPEHVTVIPSHLLNPEKYYYYQKRKEFLRVEPVLDREFIFTKHVEWRDEANRERTISKFCPTDPRIE